MAKISYFKNEYNNCKADQVKRWKFIKMMINGSDKSKDSTITLKTNNQSFSKNSQEVAESFNTFFTSVGENLADKLPPTDANFADYFAPQIEWDSRPKFSFYVVDSTDILPVVDNLQAKKPLVRTKSRHERPKKTS